LLKAADRRLGSDFRVAACLREERQPGKILHEMEELLTQRVMGMALGYEDANDAARLACDPVHKLLVGRDPIDGEDLASQPTLSRFENAPDRQELLRMSEALADCVIARHRKRLHGRAAASPSIWTRPTTPRTASNSSPFSIATTIATVICRWSAFSPSTTRRNSIWLPPCCARVMFPAPAVRSHFAPLASAFGFRVSRSALRVRLDGGFAAPEVLEFLDRQPRVEYVVNLASNAVLDRLAEPAMRAVRRLSKKSGETEHVYGEFRYKTKKTWKYERRILYKAEVTRIPTAIERIIRALLSPT